MSAREAVVADLVERLCDGPSPLVAVDGPDAAGKTTLADELAGCLASQGRRAVRVSLDGFHRPAAERLARGRLSPEGYLEDAFDLEAFRRDVLQPLAPGGARRIVPARRDWVGDRELTASPVDVPEDTAVLVDGVFLLRPELSDAWTSSVFVFARAEVVLERARTRDADVMGGTVELERRYAERYLPGQALYMARDRPHERATACVESSAPAVPVLSRAAVAAGVERWIQEHGRG